MIPVKAIAVDYAGRGYSRKRTNFEGWMPSGLVVGSTCPDRTYPGEPLSWASPVK
jgi:hypothetical protein